MSGVRQDPVPRERPGGRGSPYVIAPPITGHGPKRGCLPVLVVGDMSAPGDGAAALVGECDCDMRHKSARGGAVPVILARLKEDAVAGADDLDRAAFTLAEADAIGNPDRLAVGVGVPGGAGAGGEVDGVGTERGEASATVSTKTVPVNQSAGPAPVSSVFLVICNVMLLLLRARFSGDLVERLKGMIALTASTSDRRCCAAA